MAGPIKIAILANGRQARAEAALTARAYGTMGKGVSRAGKALAGVFAVGALVKAGAAVTKVGGEYVSSLNKIQALTGSTDKQMARIASRLESQRGAYARFGQTTGDAAQGMVELTKSGLSAQKALGAIRGTMVLAKAGEMDVASASEVVANALNVFNLKASKATKVANSLANAANISSADVSDLAESFKYVAPVAAKAGVSVDQMSALLAELSNAGIKGSQAGTTLRSMFVRLQAPTTAANITLDNLGVKIFDATGKMRSMRAIVGELGPAIDKLHGQDKAYALKNLFGLNAVTGAQEILSRGVKTFDEYSKGVKRAGAATKLAASASKGFAGTLARLKATGLSTIQSLYREFSPKLNKPLSEVADWLAKNQDHLIATGEAAAGKLVPALKTLAELATSTGKALKDAAVPLAHVLIPALEIGAKAALSVVKAFNALPSGLKSVAVEAGVAALILPKLFNAVGALGSSFTTAQAKVLQFRAEMSYTQTRAQRLSAAMTKIGNAARGAAGVGGLVLLSQASQTTNRTLSTLEATAGGAALGFSVGGPWGAAIGAGAGALYSLTRRTGAAIQSLDAMRQADKGLVGSQLSLRDALNQTTGAMTRQARQNVSQDIYNQHLTQSARTLGVTTRDLVSAVLGQEGAYKRVTAAVRKYQNLGGARASNKQNALSDAAVNIGAYLDGANAKFRKTRDEIRSVNAGTEGWKKALKGIPHDVRVKVRNLGAKPSTTEIAQLSKKYDALRSRKAIALVIKATGASATVRDVLKVRDGVKSGMDEANQAARSGTGQVDKTLASGITAANRHAAGLAGSGGRQIGGAMKAGVVAGFAGTAAQLAAQAAAAVAGAIGAAKKAGAIRSPSRKMRQVGEFLGEGLALGLARRKDQAKNAGARLVRDVLRGVDKGLSGVKSALDKIDRLIRQRLDGKKQAGRRKALLRSLRDERKALLANGKAQDANSKKLDKAIANYKQLKSTANDFAKSIRTGFTDYGSVVGLGTVGGGTAVTLPALLSQLAARANVASQFSKVIEQLKGKLNKTSLRQIINTAASGDLEGALATAQAIASGGASAVKQINTLTSQIAKAGGSLGKDMRQKFYGAGLRSADGVVKGLEKRQRKLDQIADRLAGRLVSEVRRELHIATPKLNASQTHGTNRYATAAAAPAAKHGDTYHVTLNVQAPVGSSSQDIGRSLTKHLDAYFSAGGRHRQRWN